MLNCRIMTILFVYLGVPIGRSHKRVNFGKGVLDKVRKKLSRWHGKILSMAGRVILIKFALSFMFLCFTYLSLRFSKLLIKK